MYQDRFVRILLVVTTRHGGEEMSTSNTRVSGTSGVTR
jgi:hypothetical protein